MKQKIFAIMMAIMLLGLIQIVSAQTFNSGSLKIVFVNQEPDPAEPGKYMDVRLQIENLGDTALEDVKVEFLPSGPFTLAVGQSALTQIGTVSAFQNNDQAFIIKYKVKIDSEAIQGTDQIQFRSRSVRNDWNTYNFNIDIRTTDATLSLESVKTEPSPVEPGKEAKITFKIKNMADSNLKDLTVTLDLMLSQFAASAAASTLSDLTLVPFAPTTSGTEKKITQLKSKEESTFTYDIIVYPNAESKVYKIPLLIKYFDELGNEYSKSDIIGVVVNSKPDVSVVLDKSDVNGADQQGQVSIQFINKGLANIKFLDVVIGESSAFETLTATEVYLGNIDSDDYGSADFDIKVSKDQTSDFVIPITYTYMDSNNYPYTFNKDIKIKVYSPQELKNLNANNSSNNFIFLGIIIVVVVVFIIFRVSKKKNKK